MKLLCIIIQKFINIISNLISYYCGDGIHSKEIERINNLKHNRLSQQSIHFIFLKKKGIKRRLMLNENTI